MDDEPAVREGHRFGHLQQQGQTLRGPDLALAAVVVDGQSLDVLQRHVRPPLGIQPGVVQTCDVRVFERGEDLALAREALGQARRPAQVGQFERHLALELTVGALGEPDVAHAAAADFAQQPVRPDQAARGRLATGRCRHLDGRTPVQQVVGLPGRRLQQQGAQRRRQARRISAERGQPGLAPGRVKIEPGVQQLRQLLEVGDGCAHREAAALLMSRPAMRLAWAGARNTTAGPG